MARTLIGHVPVRHSILVLLTILTANASPNHAPHPHLARSDTCPSSSQKCNGAGIPDNFCCSSSSTCVTIDSGSSVICCPNGQDCTYIEPITCDVTKQDASLHPDNVIKTTRLDDDLPTCGDSCCPFGYTCHGSFCAMDDTPSSTSTQSKTTQEVTTSTSTTSIPSSTTSSSITTSETTTATTARATSSTPTSAGDIEQVTDKATSTLVPVSTPTLSQYSTASDTNMDPIETKCPAFPTNAVLAGFFPGSVFGAVAALLLTVCIRRRQKNNLPPSIKVAQNTYRKSTGTLIGISDPIPSDEGSFRTDFLLRTNLKRNSEGARSVLQRSRSRVKSLFSGPPKPTTVPTEDVPVVPPLPLPMTPPCQRQPSTESIRVYTPPGVFATTAVLGPAPYPDHRPNTTLTEMLDRAQAQMEIKTAGNSPSNSHKSTTSTTSGTTGRWLIPPPSNSARRKPVLS